jgi:8-oxo-dGTP pyrophosphatase MutT (NUDIX family)
VIDRYQVVPAAYVYLLRRETGAAADQVLLQLRENTGYRDGYWAAAAAGHVEAGESVVRAAHREVAEELGITIAPHDLLPVTAVHRTQGNGDPIDERVDFFFTCRRWTGVPRLLEPHKAAALEWFALDALPDPVVPHEIALLTALLTALRDGGAVPPVLSYGFDEGPARGSGPGPTPGFDQPKSNG